MRLEALVAYQVAMSAFGCKADSNHRSVGCPLIAYSRIAAAKPNYRFIGAFVSYPMSMMAFSPWWRLIMR